MSTDCLSALNHNCLTLLHAEGDPFVPFGINVVLGVVVGLVVIRVVLSGIGYILLEAADQHVRAAQEECKRLRAAADNGQEVN